MKKHAFAAATGALALLAAPSLAQAQAQDQGRDADRGEEFTQPDHERMVEQYRALARERAAEARALARSSREGRAVSPEDASRAREELDKDIADWRDEFEIGESGWMEVRNQWVTGGNALTPEQWIARRAAWFDAREAWMETHRAWLDNL